MKRRNFIKRATAMSVVALCVPNLVLAETDTNSKKSTMKSLNSMSYEDALKAITNGKEVKESGKIKFDTPDLAENPLVVPIKVSVDSPMSEKEHVKAIYILNTKNSNARCLSIMLTPANKKAYLKTRVKLAETQEIVALVELNDGTFLKATKSVKVTGGSC